jgi:hypothetical protein
MKQIVGSLKKEIKLTNPWLILLKWGGKDPNKLNNKQKRGDKDKHQGNPGKHQRQLWECTFQ